MALPSSGVIRFSDVNIELGVAANTPRRLSDAAVRTLFAVPSGTIRFSNGLGKSNRVNVTVTLAANTTNYTLGTAQIPGYDAGKTDVTLVVNSGVYVYSTNTNNAGLTIAALAAGDTVTIVNNGYIMGMGGNGGGTGGPGYNPGTIVNATNGGTAITINHPVKINNTNISAYIGGGGGGGGRSGTVQSTNAGGGGAGGGVGGYVVYADGSANSAGGVGGSAGQAGGNGAVKTGTAAGYFHGAGGGGGRIFPGVGGALVTGSFKGALGGNGGGAGGGGAAGGVNTTWISGAGGSANNPGGAATQAAGGGGGGGWGASGGQGALASAVGSGGKAVNTNGYAVTWVSSDTLRVYGAVG